MAIPEMEQWPRNCGRFKVKTKERQLTKNLKGVSSGELEVSQ